MQQDKTKIVNLFILFPMKKIIISLFFIANISLISSCNVPAAKDKSVYCDDDSEVMDEFTNEKSIQQHIQSDFINSLLRDYSEQVLLTSIIAMREFHFLFPDTANLSTVINYGYELEYISTRNQGALYKLGNYLDTTENFLVIKIYNRIQSWCSLYQVLMFVFEQIRQGKYDDFNDFGEIIYKMDESKYILTNKYSELKVQSYESLSLSQQSLLIMDIITYISSLPPKQQVVFVRKFLDFFSKE